MTSANFLSVSVEHDDIFIPVIVEPFGVLLDIGDRKGGPLIAKGKSSRGELEQIFCTRSVHSLVTRKAFGAFSTAIQPYITDGADSGAGDADR